MNVMYILLIAQPHIQYFGKKKYFFNLITTNTSVSTISGTSNLIEGSGRANIVLPNRTRFHINDALYSSKSRRNLLSFKDIRRNGYHIALQEIHSLPTKITDRLNSVGNYRRNIDGTKYIIFSIFLLPFTDRIPTENYRRKCSVGNFPAICRRQLLGTIYRHNTYGKLLTEVFRR